MMKKRNPVAKNVRTLGHRVVEDKRERETKKVAVEEIKSNTEFNPAKSDGTNYD